METTKPMSPNKPRPKSLWITTLPLVLLIYFILLAYSYFYLEILRDTTWIKSSQTLNELRFNPWAKSLAAAGGVMFGLSFFASSLSYFFRKPKLIGIRKQLGIYGFILAILYSVSLQIIFPEKYFYGLIENIRTPEVILGLISMIIFAFMAIISNNWGLKTLGPKYWRPAFRTGYIAYFLLIVRSFYVEGHLWGDWYRNMNSLPPPRLLLTIFASLIIISRILMEISMRKKTVNH